MLHAPVLPGPPRGSLNTATWQWTTAGNPKLAGSWTALYFNMEQKFCTVAFVLALLKTRPDFFHGQTGGDGTLKSQEGSPFNCTSSINHTTEPHPPVRVSGNSFPLAPQEPHFHQEHKGKIKLGVPSKVSSKWWTMASPSPQRPGQSTCTLYKVQVP